MYLLRGMLYLIILKALIAQIFSDKISLKYDEILFEYDENDFLGAGATGRVYKGKRIVVGGRADDVAFKVSNDDSAIPSLKHEKQIYEIIGGHKSTPKFYQYFPETNERGAILVTELLGDNLSKLLYNSKEFSSVSVMRIGLQALEILQHIHEKKVIHFDVHVGNFALNFYNNSQICIFDFNMSEKFEIIGGSVELQDQFCSLPEFKIKSPRNDLKDLAFMLIMLLREDVPTVIWDIMMDDKKKITTKDLDDIFGNLNGKEALTAFLQFARNLTSNQPDYELFTQVLKSELKKHENDPHYKQFEWQIVN